MDFLFSVLAFAVILIPAIIIHELGHFFAAKMVGINILEFGIGFPPRAKSLFVWGETEFTLNWLPLGGFVRPLGEDMIGPVQEEYPEGDFDEEDKAKHSSYITEREELMQRGVPREKLLSVNEAKPLPRIWFMVAGAFANVLSAIIFFIITALFGLPTVQGERLVLAELPENSVLSQANVNEGDALELVNGEFFKSHADFFAIWNTATEPLELTLRHPINYENADLAGTRYTVTVTPPSRLNQTSFVLILAIIEDSPAHEAGLLPDDLIISVNGDSLNVIDPRTHLIETIQENVGINLELGVLRAGEAMTITIVPRENPPRNQGRLGIEISSGWQSSDGVIYLADISQIEYVPQSFDAAVRYSLGTTFGVLKTIWDLPGQIISGAISPEQARPVSIVGISQIGGQYLQSNVNTPWMILNFIGLISIFLGVTQLLPIPPLDGARVVFVLIEVVRGKPMSPKVEGLINQIGLVIMLALGAIVIVMDIFMPLV